MRAQATHMQSYDIAVRVDHLALIILYNLDRAAREEWGSNFRTPLQAIRQKFPYNHVHDDTSIADMMGLLAGADAVRKLTNAPHKTNGNAVTEGIGYLTNLLHDNAVESETVSEHAYAVSTSRESSPNQSTRIRESRGRGRRDKIVKSLPHRYKSRSASEWKDNPCHHCRKFKWRYQHDNDSSACFYN